MTLIINKEQWVCQRSSHDSTSSLTDGLDHVISSSRLCSCHLVGRGSSWSHQSIKHLCTFYEFPPGLVSHDLRSVELHSSQGSRQQLLICWLTHSVHVAHFSFHHIQCSTSTLQLFCWLILFNSKDKIQDSFTLVTAAQLWNVSSVQTNGLAWLFQYLRDFSLYQDS